ncbi:alcohol dehydrogenase catalytic domain-containing protein [Pseudonocardia eucalypti]|uniref:alcohol dehydrogenase n=1 Tax=Pseudonocardia eucalypti TaxID=648755 RepID=A0ABP9R985_9PSEU|nr:putative phosphonate catabolism associated alcohol dehydrogenase [Pseudonocardia eucalypti]
MTELIGARYARWDGVGRPLTVITTRTSATPGVGEALVRVDLATICGSDLHTVLGRRPSPAPGVLGHEQVGTVLAVGPGEPPRCVDGSPVVPGMRVVWSVTVSCGSCARCGRGMPQKCLSLRKYGHQPLDPRRPLTGGFATHVVLLPGTAIVQVPSGLPDVVAAPAACATATVAAVLRAGRTELAGARVLVTGAGMLGLTAVAMASLAGAHVLVVDPDPARRERAHAFGASSVSGGELPDGGVDLAVELSGKTDAVQLALDSLDVGGTLVLAGSVTPGPPVNLDPERVVRGLHTVVGVHNYRPEDLLTAVDFLVAHHDRYPFAELVAGRYGLAELDDAFGVARGGGAARQAVVPV